MPAYVYRCVCGNEEEVNFRMGTAPSSWYCGECEGWMRKAFLPTAISFKGSGFYTTDNSRTTRIRTTAKVGGK